MSWRSINSIEEIRPFDLSPITPYVTARGKQTRQPSHGEVRKQEGNPYRRMLLSVIYQAAADYHRAKRLCDRRGIKTPEDYHVQSDDVREIIGWGWKAHEWFTQDPVGDSPHKLTFSHLCQTFHADPKKLWKKIKASPGIATELGEFRSPEANAQ